jgi:hypothetical protein
LLSLKWLVLKPFISTLTLLDGFDRPLTDIEPFFELFERGTRFNKADALF